jgi:carbonic anhydrase
LTNNESPAPTNESVVTTLSRDLTAGLVVFLVALPLCLGIALASEAPLISGLLAGIVGGIVVGLFSGSHSSVSGPAAGLTVIVAAQITGLGFQTFLLAVVVAGLIQIALGLARMGFLAAFFPSSVINGLLAAIGVILILKQIPYALGHIALPKDPSHPSGHENPFSGVIAALGDVHAGPLVIALVSIAVLVLWDRFKVLKKSPVPGPLVVVLLGVGLSLWFPQLGLPWGLKPKQLVDVPVADGVAGFLTFLRHPDFTQWLNPAVYTAGLTLAAVASLETLLNLEAVDQIDPRQRTSPPSRELLAQGIGNVIAGLIGGLPVTSVIVRGSVNINAGARTKLSTISHGLLLLLSLLYLSQWLNLIPLACLAAILLVTGVKLASPALVKRMWDGGLSQFIPFAVTLTAIVLTDLLIGVAIGMVVAFGFILYTNLRRQPHRIVEKHLGGEVLRIELPTEVNFLNRAALAGALDEVPPGGHVLLDARGTQYVDPDVLGLIREFKDKTGPARDVKVSLLGFRSRYLLEDETQYVDYSTRELQNAVTPAQVLQILMDGHERFRTGHRLTRDLGRQVNATADAPHPLAVVLSCIDSRTPAELIFDLGVGDILSVRIAGNVLSNNVLGSVEFGCAVAGAKLVLVMGHTRCMAVTAAVDVLGSTGTAEQARICQHLDPIVRDLRESIEPLAGRDVGRLPPDEKEALINEASRRNVARVVEMLLRESRTLNELVREGRIAVVGAMYDVTTGDIEFLTEQDGVTAPPSFAAGPGQPAPAASGSPR